MACSIYFIKPHMNYMKQPAEKKNAWSQVIHEKDKNTSLYFSDSVLLLTRWEKGVRTVC